MAEQTAALRRSKRSARTTREELIKEYRVREILEAAHRVIGRHGFEGTTIDRVAEEARVAKGTIYLYFNNKDDLLHAAVLEGLRALAVESYQGDRPDLAPLERISNFVRHQFRLQSSHQDFLKAFILESSFVTFEPGDERGEELRRLYAEYLDFVASMLRAAIETGAIRAIDANLAAFLLSEMIMGCLRRRLMNFASTPVEADAEAVLELFLKGVQAPR
jgi:TetR/AcrR family transcriptional regulator, fatty acid metabolism regulator protein